MRTGHGKFLTLYLIVIIVVSVSIAWPPQPANSVVPSEICPKHDFSTGEYTSCYYCHNAESEGEAGFIIDTDSQNCLSCHDGTTVDAFAYTTLGSAASRIAGRAAIGHMNGVNHPFSVSYTDAKNVSPTLKLRIAPATGTVPLFNDKVECASCHDPHSCNNPLFLRISNDRSALCLACHDM
ncbi:MAG: cytochrome c3 family protein [Nitrospirae bacterium]|nr:cytochrome c3 family protein [Nitrospirota bacterium]